MSLSRQLSDLTDALDDPGTDLQAILAVLFDDLTAAVPSFLGRTMTLQLTGQPITLTAIEHADLRAARSSLQLPLRPPVGAGSDNNVVFYARQVEAFAELATDTRSLFGFDGQVLLDRHLPEGVRPVVPPRTIEVRAAVGDRSAAARRRAGG